ncbi:IclR family transcriptional regulator [Haloarcula laminariae]|uniref:IclR family transcriptional regulator n=1 Tax=Haloarcula laminariae TaxID=2961577 RepID=UPI0021C904CE|nr:IclR family transcriptional regulator [Halomicroarcula laminariae]
MIDETSGRTLKTTRTSLEILTLVLEYDGLTLGELDGMVNSPKSSIHSHLNTLREERYLVKNDGTYNVSFRLALLGEKARYQYPNETVVEEAVDGLAETTGEEANFTVYEHGRLLMFYGTSGNATNKEDKINYRSEYYLHNTAAGKAILAELDRPQIERILEKWELPQESEATITDPEQLYEELEETAARGYGIVDEEFAPGLVAVGVPVRDSEGNILGGLSVGGPKYRVDTARIENELSDQLLAALGDFESSLSA